MSAVFITGTDTDVGKTVVCALLARYFLDMDMQVITQKWVQTGCELFSEDIDTHLRIMGKDREYIEPYTQSVCPYVFPEPASAHLAAELANTSIDAEYIKNCFYELNNAFDLVLVEGLGGALVPYTREDLVLDIAADLNLPVCVVVQNKLGAVNHTLLTLEALRSRELQCLGLIYNNSPEQSETVIRDNPRIIQDITGQRSLGTVNWHDDLVELIKEFKPIAEKFKEVL